jgi:hypothetical protein
VAGAVHQHEVVLPPPLLHAALHGPLLLCPLRLVGSGRKYTL